MLSTPRGASLGSYWEGSKCWSLSSKYLHQTGQIIPQRDPLLVLPNWAPASVCSPEGPPVIWLLFFVPVELYRSLSDKVHQNHWDSQGFCGLMDKLSALPLWFQSGTQLWFKQTPSSICWHSGQGSSVHGQISFIALVMQNHVKINI